MAAPCSPITAPASARSPWTSSTRKRDRCCSGWQRRRTGEGQYIDRSQYEAMLLAVQPALIEAQATGQVPPRRGNRHRYQAPQGVYPTAGDDLWIAITVQDDAQWQALLALLPVEA